MTESTDLSAGLTVSAAVAPDAGRPRLPDPSDLALEQVVTPVFQPLVDLDTGVVVGYEALARGPRERGLEAAQSLFAAAQAQGRVQELDWACRWAAVRAAREAGFRDPLALFVNAEPAGLAGPPGETAERWREMGDLRCFAEITERALVERPGELLRLADTVRSQDWGIALDDIGANPESLALMPMLQPDVLKLDLRLLHEPEQLEVTQITHAVLSQAVDSGATVVAEGIETEQQRELAVALGARLGQGWLLGRPGPLPATLPQPLRPVGLLPRVSDRAVIQSPYAVVNDGQPARRVSRAGVLTVWRQLEQQATTLHPSPALLAALPTPDLVHEVAQRYAQLSARLPLVAALVPDGTTVPPGLRTQPVSPGDPAGEDWDLIVVSPHYAAALVAREVAPSAGRAAGDPEYDIVVTFDRSLVVRAANALLMRLDLPPGIGAPSIAS